MSVSRKGALAMLTVVVLWTAMPALSCLLPPAQHACCRGMAQGCGSPAMSKSNSCCQLHGPDATVLLLRTSTPEHSSTTSSLPVFVDMPVPHAVNAASLQMAGAAPPGSPPGNNSILRI
jgi:hypothetical protein